MIKSFLIKIVILVFTLWIGMQLWYFGHILYWIDNNPKITSFMELRLKELNEENTTGEKISLEKEWVEYSQVSNHLKRALIAAEDAKFLDHEGFDWEGMQQAYQKNIKKGRIVAGGSTITQQLAKNLFLSESKTPWRKGQEAIITVMIETFMTKRRILEIYINVIEWGNGVFGAEAASKHYYGISAKVLSAQQSARLASMVPNPRFYDDNPNSKNLKRKTNIILSRMKSTPIPTYDN